MSFHSRCAEISETVRDGSIRTYTQYSCVKTTEEDTYRTLTRASSPPTAVNTYTHLYQKKKMPPPREALTIYSRVLYGVSGEHRGLSERPASIRHHLPTWHLLLLYCTVLYWPSSPGHARTLTWPLSWRRRQYGTSP